MDLTRTVVTILLPNDSALRVTVAAFQRVPQTLAEPAYHDGQPLGTQSLGTQSLNRVCHHVVLGPRNSQTTCSAIRLTAGAYASARSNGRPAQRLFRFHRALFLVGKRGRDADFRPEGTLSIWTAVGRKRLSYTVPDACKTTLAAAKEIDSLSVLERNGWLCGSVTLTPDAPEPNGVHPVGIALNEANALVAGDPDGRTLFISGKLVKVANTCTYKTRPRVQRKHAARQAARQAARRDTHSVRRVLNRLGRRRCKRTCTFARTTAKQLVQWAPVNAVLVFEALTMPRPGGRKVRGKATRRQLSQGQRHLIRTAVGCTAHAVGMAVAEVNPANTCQVCSRCGLRGIRKRHVFVCPSSRHQAHADVNAAVNMRTRATVVWDDRMGRWVACQAAPKPGLESVAGTSPA